MDAIRPLILLEGGSVSGASNLVHYGGYLRFWKPVFRTMIEIGITPTLVFTRERNPLGDAAIEAGIETHYLGCSSALGYYSAAKKLARLIAQTQATVVHANEPIQGSICAAMTSRRTPPIIFHRHHVESSWKRRALSQIAGARSSLVMAVSNAVAKQCIAEGVNPKKIWVCHNGVNFERSSSRGEATRSRTMPGSLTVVAIGHLRYEKGFDRLIRALRLIETDIQNVRAILVGDGPERASLASLAAHSRVRVDLVGHQDDITPWLELADLVVIPSRQESSSLVAMEAMAFGCPILATQVGGLPEVVTSEVGMLVASETGAIASGLKSLLKNDRLRSHLASKTRVVYASRFTTKTMVDQWLCCYRFAKLTER